MLIQTLGHRNLSGNQVSLALQEKVLSAIRLNVFCIYTEDIYEIFISILLLSFQFSLPKKVSFNFAILKTQMNITIKKELRNSWHKEDVFILQSPVGFQVVRKILTKHSFFYSTALVQRCKNTEGSVDLCKKMSILKPVCIHFSKVLMTL